jgi:hypothetical protein
MRAFKTLSDFVGLMAVGNFAEGNCTDTEEKVEVGVE